MSHLKAREVWKLATCRKPQQKTHLDGCIPYLDVPVTLHEHQRQEGGLEASPGSKYLLRRYLDPFLPPKAILMRYLDPLGSYTKAPSNMGGESARPPADLPADPGLKEAQLEVLEKEPHLACDCNASRVENENPGGI